MSKSYELFVLVLFLLLIPTMVLTSNVRLVPPLSAIDPWLYVGAFLGYEDLYQRFGITYYVSRLPWVLYGSALHKVFSPVVAHGLMGFSVLLALAGALYSITRRFYTRSIAVFVAAFGATNPLFIYHSFWTHVDVPSSTAALWGVACVVRAEGRRLLSMSLLAGGLCAIAVLTHLFSIVVFAPAAAVWVLLKLLDDKKVAAGAAAGICAGFALGVAGFSAIGHFVYGSWTFWDAQLNIAEWVLAGGWHRWARPLSEWTPAGPLVIPFALLIAGAVMLGIRRRSLSADEGARFTYLYVLSILAIFLVTDFGMGGARLQHPWYYVFLVLPSVLCLGPVLQCTLNSDAPRQINILLGVYVAGAFGLLFGAGVWHLRSHVPAIALFGLALLLVMLLGVSVKAVPKLKLAATALFTIGLLAACIYGERQNFFASDTQWKDLQQSIAIHEHISPHLPSDRALRFFYNNRGNHRLFNSVNALFLWDYSLLSSKLPGIEESRRKYLNRPSSVVILTLDQREVEAGLQTLSELYEVEGVRFRSEVDVLGDKVHVVIADARPIPRKRIPRKR